MSPGPVAVVVVLACLTACQLEPDLQRCGELLCPAALVCIDHRNCVSGEDAQVCGEQADGSPCSTRKVEAGICGSGACLTPGCGNGVVEPDEMCDDGNTVLGDGCSADCRSDESCGNGVLDFAEACEDGRLVSGDGCSSTCREERLQFSTVDRPGPLFRLGDASLVYAASLQALVYVADGQTWLYDAAGWRRGPDAPSRTEAAIAYDASRQRVVLHGGTVGNMSQSDTWELDGTTWTQVATMGPDRVNASAAYDPVSQRVVLFGGRDRYGYWYNTVFAFDGATWSTLSPTGTPPPARQGAGFAYDPSRQAFVMVGGGFADMWQLTTAWTQVSSTVPTSWGALAYDAGRSVLMLLGTGAWETQTTTWTARTDPPAALYERTYAIAYDPSRARVVVLGGMSDEHWEVSTSWQLNAFRPGRLYVKAAFDAGARRLIVRGQYSTNTAETWAHDLVNGWTLIAPRSVPQPWADAALVYDPARRRTIAISASYDAGTYAMETWALEGTTWTKLATTGVPPVRYGHRLVFDRHRDRIVMFGGSWNNGSVRDTWALAGNTWTEVPSAITPEGRLHPPLAYDVLRRRVVLAGGLAQSPLGDCWELDGDQWQEIQPLPARKSGVLVYDEVRHRSVLFAGSDVLEFDGQTWSYAFATPLPSVSTLEESEVVYDPFTRTAISVGPFAFNSPRAMGVFTWTSGEPVESCSGTDDLDGDALSGCADPDCYGYCDPVCPPGASCAPERLRCGDGVCDAALETHDRCPEDCP